jgi:hypothetical protein
LINMNAEKVREKHVVDMNSRAITFEAEQTALKSVSNYLNYNPFCRFVI